MREKMPPSLPTLQLVYAGEPITVQCVPRQVVKSRLLIKVHPDGRVVASVPPETTEQAVLSALKKEAAGSTSNYGTSGHSRRMSLLGST